MEDLGVTVVAGILGCMLGIYMIVYMWAFDYFARREERRRLDERLDLYGAAINQLQEKEKVKI